MIAIGYVRVSTEDQAKEGVRLDNQKSKIEAYCQLKDLELSEIVEDAGISAKNLRSPGVQKVLRLAKKKKIDAIIVYKLDRIFRSTVDALVSKGDRLIIYFNNFHFISKHYMRTIFIP